MSVRRLAPDTVQPPEFAFSNDNEAWIDGQIAKYPPGRQASAVIPLLWKAQEQEGWLPKKAIEAVAARLGMTYIRVLEIATFYSMFNLEPVGRYFIQLCGTTPCQLRGAGDIRKALEARIGEQRHVTPDGNFAWLEVECLGACCNAPMIQIGNAYYEDLTPESLNALMDDLAAGRPVKPGPQSSRRSSEPEGDVKTLTDPALYDGSAVGTWRRQFDERFEKARLAKEAAAAEAAAKASPAAAATAPTTSAAAAPARPPASPDTPTNATKDTPAAGGSAIQAAGASPVVANMALADPASSPAGSSKAAAVLDDGGPEQAPPTLTAAREAKPDELQLIWGVGPKLEQMLFSMGFYHFDQIAAWTEEHLRFVDRRLGAFRGRARRDDWIGQSKKLAGGWRPSNRIGDRPGS